MGLLDKFFKLTSIESNNSLSNSEFEQRKKEFEIRYEQLKQLFAQSLTIYNSQYCQCAYPRFQQIVGIDCCKTSVSFRSYETELLINMCKVNFDISSSNLTDENVNEKWICKKCRSLYEYGWSDFSIYVERQKLKLIDLKTEQMGLPIVKPIPLYLGLLGHSYASKQEITNVTLEVFKSYMLEE